MLAGGRWNLLLALVATPALLASAGDVSCTYSDSETCPVENFSASTADGSVLVYPGGSTRCAFDDYTDSKTTFTARSTYFFQVFPTEDLDKSKLMIFFQGGGACIDKYTCNFALQCSLGASATFTTSATASSTGVLDRSLEDNMFNDWNIVHIPYCTGDLHAGSKTTVGYQSGIEALLGNTQCLGLNKSMHMNGYANTQSALQWALANYPEPEHIVIGGESAGSLAAQAYSAYVADLWDVEAKAIKYQVLADSYVGVFPEEQTPAGVILDYFGVCDVDFDAPADIVAACKAQTLTVSQLMSSLLELIPSSEWLFIDSKADTTQRTFYELVEEGIFGYPFTNIISATDFFNNMTAIIDVYESISSGISTFFVEGTKHVLLNDANFTNVVSDTGAVLGATLTSWLDSNSTPTTPSPTATPTPTPTSTTTSSPTATPTATPTTTTTSTPGTTTATPGATPATPGTTTGTPSTTTTAPSPGSTPSTTTAPSTPSSTPSSGETPATTAPTPATTAPLAC